MPHSALSTQHSALIALGANLGHPEAQLRAALDLLRANSQISVEHVSTFITTDPVGGPPGQPKYVNAAASLKISLSPPDLLKVLLTIEAQLGRDRTTGERNAPRTIDLDLLLYDDLILNESDLTIPHPRMTERRFVLEPLAEIAPGVVHPTLKRSVSDLLKEVQSPKSKVQSQ